MDTPGNDTNVEPPSYSHSTPNISFYPTFVWDPQINGPILSYSDPNARKEASTSTPSRAGGDVWSPPNVALKRSMSISTFPSTVPPLGFPDIPEDSGFIERAVRFSCFANPCHANADSRSRPMQWPDEALAGVGPGGSPFKNETRIENFWRARDGVDNGLDEFSGSDKGVGLKKRKRAEEVENNEPEKPAIETEKDTNEIREKVDEKNPTLAKKPGGKGPGPPKEEYIHVRARRGQATNSHSLAERIRREKISERMKFLQDLVPGCSKVTGKAVMLDEIINYVQSLQRQVEFLSMKLATVKPSLDFDTEAFLAKDMLSPVFSTDMITSFSPIQPAEARLIDPTTLHRPIGSQSNVVSGESRHLISRAPGIWDDELHKVVHNGFNLSASS